MEAVHIQCPCRSTVLSDQPLKLFDCEFIPTVTVGVSNRRQTVLDIPALQKCLCQTSYEHTRPVCSNFLADSKRGEHPPEVLGEAPSSLLGHEHRGPVGVTVPLSRSSPCSCSGRSRQPGTGMDTLALVDHTEG